ncbi:MAG: zinc-dependent peptidase [Steroidobacteraceae bacterium]|nr:zinc-dependent peptidase [Steroidobacteraceae bacterium]
MTAALIVLAVAATVIAAIVVPPLLARRRRARLRSAELPVESQRLLYRRVPIYRRIPADIRARLDGLVHEFVEDKNFVGCGGIEVDLEMKLVIAAQACLLVAGREGHHYDALRSILVYPGEFVVPEEWHDDDGVVTTEERVLAGQAWGQDRILLSWEDVEAGGHGEEAYNVVIHEFAHYLDEEEGAMNGTPALDGPTHYARWAEVFAHEFAVLRAAADAGQDTFLDPYAAEDEAEFFAVASETFFETPRELRDRHPRLYRELQGFYRLDPASW